MTRAKRDAQLRDHRSLRLRLDASLGAGAEPRHSLSLSQAPSGGRQGRGGRLPRDRRGRAAVPRPAARPLSRHHRHQRQIHHHRSDRPSPGAARESGSRSAANLGTPALALAPLAEDGTYVLEMSSYQLELVPSARFDVGVLLNITPDHLDRHGGMAGYAAAKARIFQHQKNDDWAVIGIDDEPSRRHSRLAPRRASMSPPWPSAAPCPTPSPCRTPSCATSAGAR